MTVSQDLYDKAKASGNVKEQTPFLELGKKVYRENKYCGTQSTGVHKVKFISDKVIEGKNFGTGVVRQEVEYLFEEDGKKFIYRKPVHKHINKGRDETEELHYFVQKMKQFEYGDMLELEYIKIDAMSGYIDARAIVDVGTPSDTQNEPQEDDIPLIVDGDEVPF